MSWRRKRGERRRKGRESWREKYKERKVEGKNSSWSSESERAIFRRTTFYSHTQWGQSFLTIIYKRLCSSMSLITYDIYCMTLPQQFTERLVNTQGFQRNSTWSSGLV
jgi:hypothetical protein